jgi:hypothetical protein
MRGKYSNAVLIEQRCGVNSALPKVGDSVRWTDGRLTWIVTEEDIEGPSALQHWPDRGWCNVVLLKRDDMLFYEDDRKLYDPRNTA